MRAEETPSSMYVGDPSYGAETIIQATTSAALEEIRLRAAARLAAQTAASASSPPQPQD